MARTLVGIASAALLGCAPQAPDPQDAEDPYRPTPPAVVQAMLACREKSTFIPVLANAFARNAVEIEVAHAERAAGESKYSLFKLVNLQFDLLTSMTTTPLRLMTWFGAVIAMLGIGFGAALLALRLFADRAWWDQFSEGGVFTMFAILFVFVGFQFMAMGLLGEYLGRVFHDVRDRPRYFVHEVAGEGLAATPIPRFESARFTPTEADLAPEPPTPTA